VRVSTAKLSAVLLQSEEMLTAKLSAGQRAAQMREAAAAFNDWKKQWAKALPAVQKARSGAGRPARNDRETGAALARVFEFLEWNSAFVNALAGQTAKEAKAAERDSWAISGMVSNLLEDAKKVLMFPFSSLLEIFPKIVRDLSRDSGKEVELAIRGGEIEIDRRILEEMKDPLMHLVRNGIDHGIEKPQEREARGKPRSGTITISIAPKDGKVELVVADDGAGISTARLRAAVQKLGQLTREQTEELAEGELLPLIFQSGVTTSPLITEISGRGLGLAIVKEKVEKLGGTVALETRPDAGTVFRIVLPLTIATFRGILVRAGEHLFVLPTTHVERAVRVGPEEIRTVENRETIQLDGRAVSLARLAAVLELGAPRPAAPPAAQAVVLSAAGQCIAFAVDEVLGEQEVLFKNLGPQLSRVRNVAGATALGSGRVVPILNVPDLMKSAIMAGSPRLQPAPEARAEQAGAGPRRSILVVEDSITSRALLKNILESAGYEVMTAVDGADGLTQLRSNTFDIVVSDVDMPRMNGFDLTARIRADRKLAELPVVLVTALGSREDRERGIDVGANAYIVKSSFDQSNLLEVVKRLI
jgi:two-component system chemotaxis sensor kinase CheA